MFLWPQLDGMDMENTWLQQDGATCHTACETMELLGEKFPGRVISAMAIGIGHRDRAICHRATSFFGGFVKSRV